MFGHGETVTIVRPTTTTDRYGNVVSSWEAPTLTSVHDVAVAPRMSEEDNERRSAVIRGLTLYVTSGAEIRSTDRVRVRGDDYEVIGDVGVWRNPYTGWDAGLTVNLERVEG